MQKLIWKLEAYLLIAQLALLWLWLWLSLLWSGLRLQRSRLRLWWRQQEIAAREEQLQELRQKQRRMEWRAKVSGRRS